MKEYLVKASKIVAAIPIYMLVGTAMLVGLILPLGVWLIIGLFMFFIMGKQRLGGIGHACTLKPIEGAEHEMVCTQCGLITVTV